MMKKRSRSKAKTKKSKAINPADELASFTVEQDLAVLLKTLVEKLSIFERKLDTVLSRLMSAPVEAPRVQTSALAPERRREHNHLHKAVCADCGKDCELPFKPSVNRPVYCRECFARRKSERIAKLREEIRPATPQPLPVTAAKTLEAKKVAASSRKKPKAKKTTKKVATSAKKKKVVVKKKTVKKTVKKKAVRKK